MSNNIIFGTMSSYCWDHLVCSSRFGQSLHGDLRETSYAKIASFSRVLVRHVRTSNKSVRKRDWRGGRNISDCWLSCLRSLLLLLHTVIKLCPFMLVMLGRDVGSSGEITDSPSL